MTTGKEKKPADEEKTRGGCLATCSSVVAHVLETAFCKFGRLVGGYPWVTILIASIIGLCCAAGMIKFQQESRTEKLWVPVGSQILGHQDFVDEHYPSESRFAVYTVEADNVLTPNVLQKMLALHADVLDITVDEDGDIRDWDYLCYRLGQHCFISSLLELWSFNSTIINSLSQQDILDKVNEDNLVSPVFFSPIDLEARVGELSRDDSGRITGGKATIMTFFLQDRKEFDTGSGDYVDVVGEAWETKFVELPDDTHITSDFMVYKFTASSFSTESGESISGDLTLLAAGYFLIIIYVVIAMSKLTMIEHKVYVSLAGILTVGLSIISAMGLASAFGQAYGPVHSVLPFLLLGIGVDDMFVLVAAWYNLSEEDKHLDVTEQVARSLKHSGVSITVTSVTDFCAFLIGATTILPALRSFCIYCGIGIIFLFFYSVTFFLAWLVIDHKRYERRLDACCCCFRHKDDYEPSKCGQRSFLQEFFYKYYSPAILNIPVKVLVLVITFGLLGVCMWGAVTWEQNFDFKWFLPADGDSRAYFDANEKYFPANGFNTAIYLDEVDYYNERDKMDALYQEFQDSVWIQDNSVSSWYESYEAWLSTAKAGHPDLNADNWPKNEILFYDWLGEFLASPMGRRFAAGIKFNNVSSSSDRIVTSRITANHIVFDNSVEEVSGMDNVRAVANNADFAAGEDAAFGYSDIYLNFESNKVIQNELLRNLGLASACVFIVILILLANILQTLLVFCCVIFTLVDLAGALNFWGITIDTVVAVILILAIGLAVDYSVHIGHTFMIFSGTRHERTRSTLGCMGAAVLNGGFSTFLAFILLAASNSYIFTTFFKIFLLVVIFGLFHGLVFLPVILSLVGPSPYLSATPAAEFTFSDKSPRSVTPEQEQDQEKVVENGVEAPNGDPRMSPHYNPAFVKEDDVEMRDKSQTNGSAGHQRIEMGRSFRPVHHHHHHPHPHHPHPRHHHPYNYDHHPPQSTQHFPIHRPIFMDQNYEHHPSSDSSRIHTSYRSQAPPNIRHPVGHVDGKRSHYMGVVGGKTNDRGTAQSTRYYQSGHM